MTENVREDVIYEELPTHNTMRAIVPLRQSRRNNDPTVVQVETPMIPVWRPRLRDGFVRDSFAPEPEDRRRRRRDEDDEDESWEARCAKFKQAQKQAGPPSHGSDLDEFSEGGDTIGDLPQLSVIGGKKRRKGTSDASGYSMSSSSMFRNQGLTLIDEQFEQVRSLLK